MEMLCKMNSYHPGSHAIAPMPSCVHSVHTTSLIMTDNIVIVSDRLPSFLPSCTSGHQACIASRLPAFIRYTDVWVFIYRFVGIYIEMLEIHIEMSESFKFLLAIASQCPLLFGMPTTTAATVRFSTEF